MFFPLRLAAALAAATTLAAIAPAKDYRITIGPADVDRAVQVITFKLPQDASQPAVLRTPNGQLLPVQVDDSGDAAFIVPRQKAHETLSYTLSGSAAVNGERIEARADRQRIHVTIGGAPLFDY